MQLITTPTMTMSMHIQMRSSNHANKDKAVKPQSTDKRAAFCEMYLNCELQMSRKRKVWTGERYKERIEKRVGYKKLMPFDEAGSTSGIFQKYTYYVVIQLRNYIHHKNKLITLIKSSE